MSEPRSAEMLRVDQAGEYGATRIYAGQLAVMGSRGAHSAEIGQENSVRLHTVPHSSM